MNLLEHYIKEIHEVCEVVKKHKDGTEEFLYLLIDVTYDCYGRINRDKNHYVKNYAELEKIKEKGYYLV